ncbi:MAG: nucleotidyltransferase domain-containing protein [Candidatus Calescibacterium sp.]
MTISPEEIESIKRTIKKYDQDAKIILFGSRTNPEGKGGDIDLIVISKKIDDNARRMIRVELILTLGERKIDLIVTDNPSENLFTKIMVETGVEL